MKFQLYCRKNNYQCKKCDLSKNSKDCQGIEIDNIVKTNILQFNQRKAAAIYLCGKNDSSFLFGYLLGVNTNYFSTWDDTNISHITLLDYLHSKTYNRMLYSQGYLTGYKGKALKIVTKGKDDYGRNIEPNVPKFKSRV